MSEYPNPGEQYVGAKIERERRREEAEALAQELSEVSMMAGSKLPEVKPRMKKLLDHLKALGGEKVLEERIGEDGIVRFYPGDKDKPYNEGRFHVLEYLEDTDHGEERKVFTAIDAADGGSMLMDAGEGTMAMPIQDIPGGGTYIRPDSGWLMDEEYEKDILWVTKERRGFYDQRYAPIGANRLREMRVTARMVRMLLSGEKQDGNNQSSV